MLMPHSNCQQEDAYELYKLTSGPMAIDKDKMHTIPVENQDCETMAVHPLLGSLRDMYNDKDLSFIGNLGMLQESKVNKKNWARKHKKIQLFAHDKMHQETLKMDIFDDGKVRTTLSTNKLPRYTYHCIFNDNDLLKCFLLFTGDRYGRPHSRCIG